MALAASVASPAATAEGSPPAEVPAWGIGKPLSPPALSDTRPWRFVVLSDIHVFSNARIPDDAIAVVKQVARMRPRLVVITGDSTNGNRGDRFSVRSIGRWWKSVHALLQPLYDAKIPVLSVAGNHDTYRVRHRQGYAKAWADQAARAAPLTLSFGKTPFYYSVDVGGVHLVLLNIVTQHIDKRQEQWLERDLSASNATLKLVFGHVPIQSTITRSVRGFRDKMVPLLAKHGVNTYIAGHEHLVWDETLRVGQHRLRQLTCGTASGTYNYGIRPSLIKRHCTRGECRWLNNGYVFRVRKTSREQWNKTTVMAIDVLEGHTAIQIHPYYLARDRTLKQFRRAASSGQSPATR